MVEREILWLVVKDVKCTSKETRKRILRVSNWEGKKSESDSKLCSIGVDLML